MYPFRDYWHVPDQYTLVRTQAKVYFPSELYDVLEDALISYGESRLGCRAISPIWMSYYVDGCSQVWKGALKCGSEVFAPWPPSFLHGAGAPLR